MDLLFSAAPPNTLAAIAAEGLRVWLYPTAPPIGARLLILFGRAGGSVHVSETRISWDLVNSGSAAYYTVIAAEPDGVPTVFNPHPLLDMPGQQLQSYLFMYPTAASPFIMGYDTTTIPTPAPNTTAPPHPPSRRRGRSDRESKRSASSSSPSPERHHHRYRKHHRLSGEGHSSRHPRRHSSYRSGSGSSSSGSEPERNDATTMFKDAADRPIKRVKGSSMQVIRNSEPLRAFAPPAQVDALLEAVGNEINNYSAANFCTGATDIYIARQVASGSANRDPSWYTLPAFHDTVWYDQRDTSPAIASKVVYFGFTMSRNWTPESLRGFHFLPKARAAALANGHFNYARDDWMLMFRGLAVTYGALYDAEYQSAFQEMHSHICNEQIGQSYTFPFLESAVNDWFFRLGTAARNPRAPFILPGYTEPAITFGFTPRKWADVFRAGFYTLIEQLDNPLHFQTYNLRRVGQPAYPMPMHKPSRGPTSNKRQQGSDHTPAVTPSSGGASNPAPKGRGKTPPPQPTGLRGSCATSASYGITKSTSSLQMPYRRSARARAPASTTPTSPRTLRGWQHWQWPRSLLW
jgi:hypothetical protein